MKMLVGTAILALALAAVASAAPNKELVGSQISVLTGEPTTFTAGAPFHVVNCWHPVVGEDRAIGEWTIGLTVDGVSVDPNWTLFGGASDGTIERCYGWNFPSGLSAGTHTFVETFYTPCYRVSTTCSDPNAQVVYDVKTLTVAFV